MPLSTEIKDAVYQYCNNHLADEAWYNGEFEFIEDQALRKRLIEEFKGIRFAYKLYEKKKIHRSGLTISVKRLKSLAFYIALLAMMAAQLT